MSAYIRIITIPDGEAPLSIRKAWVGLILPCDPIVGYSDDREKGVLSLAENGHNRYGYSVPQKEALDILELSDSSAASWWRAHGFPKTGSHESNFGFYERDAEVVQGEVTWQKVTHVTEEMMGDPYR